MTFERGNNYATACSVAGKVRLEVAENLKKMGMIEEQIKKVLGI